MTKDIDNICNEIRKIICDINISSHKEAHCVDRFIPLYDLIELLENKIVKIEKKNSTWQDIGKRFNITKQAAHQRFKTNLI